MDETEIEEKFNQIMVNTDFLFLYRYYPFLIIVDF